PRPLPGHRRADQLYTLNCEEPDMSVKERDDVRMLTLFGVPKLSQTTRKSGLVAAGGSCDREVREAE
ncbi:hypothetical protein ACFPJ1_02610, partial [Kribbella qitaiheensis]|uniref:hypothetical protein n=1 Tax=Kribbella qitaiheensis TaxID=1544730 RepID=UPI003623135B